MNWLAYANEGATRNDPLSPDLVSAMSFLPELGIRMEVFSGGQEPAGAGGSRTGSVRHDHGNAADVFFYDAQTGRRLDWANPEDVPRFQEIVRRAREAGVAGFGAGPGYMQPGSMHIGFGSPAVWGAGGRGATAPDWLRQAFGGGGGASAPPGATTSAPSAAPGSAPPSYTPPAPVPPQITWADLAQQFGTIARGNPPQIAQAYDPYAVAQMFRGPQ